MFQTKRTNTSAGRNNNALGLYFNSKTMEKGLKIWQAVLGTVVLLISFITIIVNMATTINEQGLEINYLKGDNSDFKLQIKDINQRQEQQYKEINSKLTDILLQVNNKENRK